MATQSLPYVTPEQYLEYDRNSEFRNEYIYGEIIPMESGTPWHSLIGMNVGSQLNYRLSGTPCRVFNSSLRVSLDLKAGYVYPDVTVVCGQLVYVDGKNDAITNPKIVVEVLSPSTMDYDLGTKTRLYWAVASLTDLILIRQDRIWIEHWFRTPNGKWDHTLIEDPAGILKIESANIEIPVTEIYTGVELPPPNE
jgi:Uma2 family endonuclease